MKKAEFHVHTCASKDSIQNKFLMLLMLKIKKVNCIAITDHNEIKFAQKNKEFFQKKGINVIIGEEIFTSDGEIIGLFLNKRIEPNLTAEETIKQIKKQNGIVYIPHPYDLKRKKTVLKTQTLEKLHKEIDLIEVHNGRNISFEYSVKQNEIAEKYGIRKIIGSDAHTFFELGRNYCVLKSVNRENLLSSIEEARFKKKKCIMFAHRYTSGIKIIKLLWKGDVNEIVRIIKRKIKRRR